MELQELVLFSIWCIMYSCGFGKNVQVLLALERIEHDEELTFEVVNLMIF